MLVGSIPHALVAARKRGTTEVSRNCNLTAMSKAIPTLCCWNKRWAASKAQSGMHESLPWPWQRVCTDKRAKKQHLHLGSAHLGHTGSQTLLRSTELQGTQSKAELYPHTFGHRVVVPSSEPRSPCPVTEQQPPKRWKSAAAGPTNGHTGSSPVPTLTPIPTHPHPQLRPKPSSTIPTPQLLHRSHQCCARMAQRHH